MAKRPTAKHEQICAPLASARVNFFMADMQSGIGPFVGMRLSRSWTASVSAC